MSTNYTSHVMSTPITLSGQGIQGTMHGNFQRYLSTQMVYCGCRCLCCVFVIKIRENIDIEHHATTPLDPYYRFWELKRNKIQNYHTDETHLRLNLPLNSHMHEEVQEPRSLHPRRQGPGFAPLLEAPLPMAFGANEMSGTPVLPPPSSMWEQGMVPCP
jgi:hypothetical protein